MSAGAEPGLTGTLVAGDAGQTCGAGGDPNLHNDYPTTLHPLGTQECPCTETCSHCSQKDGAGGGAGGTDWLFGGGGAVGGAPGIWLWTTGADGSGGDDGKTLWPLSLCGPALGCVDPDAMIALCPEGQKRASDVALGDVLLTMAPDGRILGEEVIAVRTSGQPKMRIELASGSRLVCSLSHDVIAADPKHAEGHPLCAIRVGVGDALRVADGSFSDVNQVTRLEDGPVVLLELAGPHHVYQADGVWSHNAAYKREKTPDHIIN